MLKQLKYENIVEIDDIPIQWLPKIELYYPDLPGFPIVYVHTLMKGKRIYGCPVTISYTFKKDNKCDARILFISNSPDYSSIIKERIKGTFWY